MTDIFQRPYYRFNKVLLCCVGLWPFQSRAERLLILAFIASVITLQMSAQILAASRCQDFDAITESTPPIIIILLSTITITIASFQTDKILKMVQRIEIDWIFVAQHPEMHILCKYAEKGKQFSVACAVGTCLFTILYLSQPYLPGFQEVMELSNETISKSLPLPADYFGLEMDVYYYYMLAWMYFFYVYIILILVSLGTLFTILVQHACGMFTVVGHQLQRMANDITEECADQNVQRHLIVCIKKHIDVIEFSEILKACCAWIFLPILGISAVVIGVAGFQTLFMIDKNPKGAVRYVLFPMCMVISQFILSIFSQMLMDHSKRISEYLYQAEWYKTTLATQKLLNLVIMRAHVPCWITAGEIITMSLENFVAVLKTSMSYFAVMRSMQ